MVLQDVVDEYNRYVLNDVPIRMIDLYKMELVDRGAVRSRFHKDAMQITEQDTVYEENRLRGWNDTSKLERLKVIQNCIRKVVPYAIFSHRWSDEGELSYKEIKGHGLQNGGNGGGYRKLMMFCEVARRCGFEFAWSDTCCIDKTSSTELDESIRSMFRWYRNSSLCVVHLAQTTSFEDLMNDEWFKRGWTLQELLAPQKMKFFNAAWEPLTEQESDKWDTSAFELYLLGPLPGSPNDKDSAVMMMIAKAAGIPLADLPYFEPGPWEIDKRMTWAAGRRTTRGEDVAYSLMGIFDVSLQIAYGEGTDRAFSRLIEAIMLAGGDPTVLNWAGRPAKHPSSRALPPSPASYAGHPDLYQNITQLDMALTSRGLRVPLVIIPLNVNVPSSLVHPQPITFHCPLLNVSEITIALKFTTRPGDVVGFSPHDRFALGIFTYHVHEDAGGPILLPKNLAAYLLRREKGGWELTETAQEGTLTPWSSELELRRTYWDKVATGFIHVDVPMIPDSTSLLNIRRSRLETVYL